MSAATVLTIPLYICPVAPSSEIKSPSFTSTSAKTKVLFLSLSFMASQPDTQHFPMPLATTAACDVIPPCTVSIPCATAIPSISSGEVSFLTKITFSPRSDHSFASLAVNTTLPHAAPGDAANPLPNTRAVTKSFLSNCGCNNASNCLGSTRITASFSVKRPSSTISTAIFKAAAAVRFPLRVWSMNNFPSSIVNSISCISL